ncbi:MAG: conjugative transposon protein TraM, partial [Prevotellaceae bacterium]|nr:conjugative transposon protein TraM [Prevotellaceae bacterium]
WLIFSPSADDKAKERQTAGFNTDIPMPKEEDIVDNKKDAYEQDFLKQRQAEKMRSLQDFSTLLENKDKNPTYDLSFVSEDAELQNAGKTYTSPSRQQSSVQSSTNAYRDINRTLNNFYETPAEDREKQQLKQELDDLKSRIEEGENRKKTIDEQMTLMEKSFQMAAKYIPAANLTNDAPIGESSQKSKNNICAVSVNSAAERVVSALPQDISQENFIKTFSKPRNIGFYTATNEIRNETKNTVSACIHDNQTILSGQSVRLRLLETVQANDMIIPRNAVISGEAKIQGERLFIIVNSLEYSGKIITVDLSVYDSDGQQGVFIPDLQDVGAAKEIIATTGSNAGTSINLSNDAGKQFVADMGRNIIQGVSQLVTKKLQEVKIYLKAGYKVFLISEENLKQQTKTKNNSNLNTN